MGSETIIEGMARKGVASRLRVGIALLQRYGHAVSVRLKDLGSILKWPVLLGLFGAEVLAFWVAILGIGWAIGAGLNIALVYLFGIAVWSALNSPVIYLTVKKIREERSDAKIKAEGWEGHKTTEELVKEYQEILDEEKEGK